MSKFILKALRKTAKSTRTSLWIRFFVFLFFVEIKPCCLIMSHKWIIKSSVTFVINSYEVVFAITRVVKMASMVIFPPPNTVVFNNECLRRLAPSLLLIILREKLSWCEWTSCESSVHEEHSSPDSFCPIVGVLCLHRCVAPNLRKQPASRPGNRFCSLSPFH